MLSIRVKAWTGYLLSLGQLFYCWRCHRWLRTRQFYHTTASGVRMRYNECSACQVHPTILGAVESHFQVNETSPVVTPLKPVAEPHHSSVNS